MASALWDGNIVNPKIAQPRKHIATWFMDRKHKERG